jgi:cytidine deaminase
MSLSDEALLQLAHQARERAYAPYSGFSVGAALEADDGRVFTGCNVENASYPVALCAERGAVSAAVAAGARRFVRVAVSTHASEPVAPCGACRQVLAEFGPHMRVVAQGSSGIVAWSLEDLLPARFVLRGTEADHDDSPHHEESR